ncbi:MAG: FG-GAP-like repeat-containing protein [Candidatus Thermoplasmatota archaeon]
MIKSIRNRLRQGRAYAIVGLLLMLTFIFPTPTYTMNAKAFDYITHWSDLKQEKYILFSPTTPKEYLYYISVPKTARAVNATMKISAESYLIDEEENYLSTPVINIGADDSVEWSYNGVLGLEKKFYNEDVSEEISLVFDEPRIEKRYIKLPVTADSTVKKATFVANSTKPGNYEYNVKLGTTEVWNKNAITFYLDSDSFLTTPGILNSVAVGDLDNDGDMDAVAGSTMGKFFLFFNKGNGIFGSPIEIKAPADTDIKDVAIADVDPSNHNGNDTIGIGSNGKFYFSTNNGVGVFTDVIEVAPATPNKGFESLAVGMVSKPPTHGSGIDLIAGGQDGKIYVAINEGNGDFLADKWITISSTGTGISTMKDVAIGDGNCDMYLDIIGANGDGSFYFAKNNGDGTFGKLQKIEASPGKAMNAVAFVDLDNDNDPDVIGASQNGKFYISKNQADVGGTFEKAHPTETGTGQSMKALVIGDVDRDFDIDIVGINTDKNFYVGLNKVIERGKSEIWKVVVSSKVDAMVTGIAAGDMDNDKPNWDMDIVVVRNSKDKQFMLWRGNLGAFNVISDNFAEKLNTYIKGAGKTIDEYGNSVCNVEFNIESIYKGNVIFRDLNIYYTYPYILNFTASLNNYITIHETEANETGWINVPVKFSANGYGVLNVTNLFIEYDLKLVGTIESPTDGSTAYTDQLLTFKGYANHDPDGKKPDFAYTWTSDGTTIGTTSSFTKRGAEIGKGMHTIEMSVKNIYTNEEHKTRITIIIQEATAARVWIWDISVGIKKLYDGDRIDISIRVYNFGNRNATNVQLSVYDSIKNENITPQGLLIQSIPINTSEIREVEWVAKKGEHMIKVDILLGEGYIVSDTPPPNYTGTVTASRDPMTGIVTYKKDKFYVEARPTTPPWFWSAGPIIAGICIVIVIIGFATKKLLHLKAQKLGQIQQQQLSKDEIIKQYEMDKLYGRKEEEKIITIETTGKEQRLEYDRLYSKALSYGKGLKAREYAMRVEAKPALGKRVAAKEYEAVTAVRISPKYRCPKCGKESKERDKPCIRCSVLEMIPSTVKLLDEVRELGISVKKIEELLSDGREALARGEYSEAFSMIKQAKENAEGLKAKYEDGVAMMEKISVQKPKPKPVIVSASPGGVCRNCGKSVDKKWKKCPYCLAKLIFYEKPTCPDCGKEIDVGWKICPFCQAKIG